ncbi:multiheme c-type cytochrome [Haliangium sp.]
MRARSIAAFGVAGVAGVAGLIALSAGCGGPEPQASEIPPTSSARLSANAEPAMSAAVAGAGLAAVVPGEPGRFAPAHTRLAIEPGRDGTGSVGDVEPGGEGLVGIDGLHLADSETCADCHPDVAAQWQGSAHAFASLSNPIYRASLEGFRAAEGAPASRFCGGCHDLALVVDGALDPGGPGGAITGVAADDARAHTGVSCRVCHGIGEVARDGNGSITLRPEPIPLPREHDQASLTRHREAVRPRRDICVGCHRSFLGPDNGHPYHLAGMDDFADWEASAFALSGTGRVDEIVPERDCVDCHMPPDPAPLGDIAATDGAVASHRFPGGHTWLAAMRGDDAELARVQTRLEAAVTLDIAAAVDLSQDGGVGPSARGPRYFPAERAPLTTAMAIDVVVRNRGVGHRFPGGVRDAQDVWIELVVRDARGAVVAASGLAHERDPGDQEAHVLRTSVADAAGQVLLAHETEEFRGQVSDHTVAARDAAVVRYRLDLPAPARVRAPLTVAARLRHRSRTLTMQRAACEAFESAHGRAFAAGSRDHREVALDPCRPQPVTTVAAHQIQLGRESSRSGAEAGSGQGGRPVWERSYEHGLAWLHATQEHVHEARPSLEAALAALGDAQERERAMVMTALGTLAGRQGRTEEALMWLDRAAVLAPGHPAIATSRGAALARVWRWQEAEVPLAQAAEKVPRNARAQALWAIALGSLGRDREAVVATHAGLGLVPRDEALLRVQAVALQALGADDAASALSAYDRFRMPDQALGVRFACAAESPACAREQAPVHVHQLVLAR